MTGPVFREGETVELRPVEADDHEFLQRVVNDPRVREGSGHREPRPFETHREELERIVDADDQVSFLVTDDGERLGVAAFFDVDETAGNAEVGYFFAPDAWGQGYATDALRTLATYGFEERRLHKLYAHLFADNDGSRRVLEKVGFRKEGHFREHHYHRGEYRDRLQYGLTVDEWREQEA